MILISLLESLSSSVFEDSKHEGPKSAELNIGTNSVSRSESPQREELNISQPKVDSLEETIDNAMEVSSVETTEDLTSKELGSQSQESLAPVPMEVDPRIPSSGVSSGEQTPDNSQTPTVLVSNEREGLEMKQTTVEDSEKDNYETSGEDAKEKEETGSSEQEKPTFSEVASEPCTEEKVGGEMSANMEKLAEQETVLNVEKPSKEEENSETSEPEKNSAEENAREESEALADNKDVEENAVTDEKPEHNAEPEKMEIDAVSNENGEAVQMDKNTSDDSSTPTTNTMTTTAETVAVPAQSSPAVETKRPPLTVEQQAKKKELMDRCILALEYCLRRFPQHHKSRYRLAFVYYYSPEHKVTQQFLQ